MFILGMLWRLRPAWFVARFDVPYPHAIILSHYRYLLHKLPDLFLLGALVLFALALALWLAARRRTFSGAWRRLPAAAETENRTPRLGIRVQPRRRSAFYSRGTRPLSILPCSRSCA